MAADIDVSYALRVMTDDVLKNLTVKDHSGGDVYEDRPMVSVYDIGDARTLVPGLLMFGGLARRVVDLRDYTPDQNAPGLFNGEAGSKLYRGMRPSSLTDYLTGLDEYERVQVLEALPEGLVYAAGILSSTKSARAADINPTLFQPPGDSEHMKNGLRTASRARAAMTAKMQRDLKTLMGSPSATQKEVYAMENAIVSKLGDIARKEARRMRYPVGNVQQVPLE